MEKTLKITEEQAKKLYLEASANLKEILESNFGKATFLKNFRDTVKTYEDACEIIGEKPIDEQHLMECGIGKSEIAFIKLKTMIALIITSLLGDYSGIAEEVEKQLQYQDKKQESDKVVSIHQFDMLSRSYDAKFDECEKLKARNQELEKSNIKLMETVNKYRYFIECQRNEIDKL